MKKKNTILKIVVISLLVLTILAIVRTAIFYYKTKDIFLEDAKKEAMVIKDYMLSMRKVYQNQFLSSEIELNYKTIGFLPAHASSKISDEFMRINKNSFYIRNVSSNPRNPENNADIEEKKAIEYFKNNPDKKEYFKKYEDKDKEFYQYATPIYMKQQCISCHGKKEETIPAIQKMYSSAFDYKLGDIRGIVSIKVPKDNIFDKINTFIIKEIFFTLISIALIYFILIYLYTKTKKHISTINQEAKAYAFRDSLTGLLNRHFLEDAFSKKNCCELIKEENKKFAIAFIDIDFFKKINDTYGHDIGDCVLKQFSKKIESIVRSEDLVCRYGGEEFLLIMKSIDERNLSAKLEFIRKTIEKMTFECEDDNMKHITISIGVSYNNNNKKFEEIIKEADLALYEAKETGRNKVCIYKDI